jgi:signal transduction histidine kinase
MEPSGAQPYAASILVVDDTLPNLELLSSMLKAHGYRVRPVPSGELALQAAQSSPPDLILLDIHMPEMNGYEVCERLKADEKLQDIPVLFISGLSETTDKVEAFRVGGADYITKPFQFEEVEARVATHLELRRQRWQLRESYEQLQKLESLRDDLTLMIVHDLRTPLTSIVGALDLVSRTEEDVDLRQEMLSMAVNATGTMMGLINDLLDVAKMENNTPDLDLTAVSLGEIMTQVRDLTAEAALERGLSLEMLPPDPPIEVRADADFLRRALTNLVDNALKMTLAGEVRVWGEADAENRCVALRVRDTGLGIPPEAPPQALAHIFEKFGQTDWPADTPRIGTGVGLTLVKMAVEAMGGRVEVESEVGQGSTFTLYLPLATGES